MKFLILLLLTPLFSQSQFSEKEISRFKTEANRVTIIRDNWGVPHIYGKTDADVVFGLLYAQCEENFKQVEENNLEMLGRLSELRGKSELYKDLQMRLIYDSSAAIADYKKSPGWFKKLMDAAADGVNYYLYKNPQTKPAVLKRFEPWYALMRTDGSIDATQTGGLTMRDMLNLYQQTDNTVSYSEMKIPFFESEPNGSNGFALSPSRTASKNAVLYINPHTSFYFRSEVQLVSEEGLNTYGAVTWGTFFVYQGFNEHCGWMHTSSYADVADLFVEKIEKKDEKFFYEYDGKTIPVRTKNIRIAFKDGDHFSSQSFAAYSTIHGPVMGSRNGQWLSLKENNRSPGALMQSWLRTKANGFEDFKKIMDMRVNNSNNTVFADDKGNIAYWHGNFMPKRNTNYDYSMPVDGSISATNWKGLHSLEEVVHVYNPSTGWIENCNSTPFTVAGSSSPKKENFPVYMAPDGQNYRAINAMHLLEHADNMTIDKTIREIGYDHYLSAFEVLLPPLFSAFDLPDTNQSLKMKLRPAISLLKSWDMNASAASIPTTIAIEWGYRMLQKASPSRNSYDEGNVVRQVTTAVQNTSPIEKLQLLDATLDDLKNKFGRWDIAWGEVNRYQRPVSNSFDDSEPSLPVGLGPGNFGSIPSFTARRTATARRYGYHGNSFIACVEFGKKLKAKSIRAGGQSFDPQSKHFSDQAQMYIDGDFKDVLFYKEDVLKHVERKYRPGE
jgi:acyl-homoserine-lactone acylase